ncbi:hypothetical protein GCM10008969_37870 [Pseudomonas veronii subsp. inensis]|uniref:tail fiber assembly protein n=1 Tax=Pseudomonas veronii TaxID=76761 RepID=UPI0031F95458
MRTYVRVCDGLVVEIFETDGDITEMFHPDLIWVDVSEISPMPMERWVASKSASGWRFAAPAVLPPTEDELKADAMSRRDALLAVADEASAGMADAFIAGLLNEQDEARFKLYAVYKLNLSKIDKQVGFPGSIVWPALQEMR